MQDHHFCMQLVPTEMFMHQIKEEDLLIYIHINFGLDPFPGMILSTRYYS